MIRYEGTIAGFRTYALPTLRRAAMKGLSIRDDRQRIQRELRKAEVKDVRDQVLRGPKPAA